MNVLLRTRCFWHPPGTQATPTLSIRCKTVPINALRHAGLLLAVVLLAGCGSPATSRVVPPQPDVEPAKPSGPAVVVRDDLRAVFERAGVKGTFASFDVAANRLIVVDQARAERRAVPASTFKVAHSLIALEVGVVRDIDEVIPYGGVPQPVPAWERDMSIREALPASNFAIFQEIARRVGPEREKEWLARLNYGNGEVGSRVDRFWLDGPLEISPVEQTRFLARLAERRLPAAPAAQDGVARLLEVERSGGYSLHGKTGWRARSDPQLGWWVGWVDRPGGIVSFALNIDMAGGADTEKRIPLGREVLRSLQVLP